MQSCEDKMKAHYENEKKNAVNINLLDYIKSDTSLSTFYLMLNKSGYDSVLNSLYTFTVWAPDNEALRGIDLNNSQLVKDIVTNHIARFLHSASGNLGDTIYTLNGKRQVFVHNGTDTLFTNVGFSKPGVLATNGIVYTLNDYVRFFPNIYEYISRTAGLDSLWKFVLSQNQKKFLPELSDIIGKDADGNNVYDSAFQEGVNVLFYGNDFFQRLGNFANEDSSFTALLPNNNAWVEAYNRIKSYYVSNDPLEAKRIQQSYTQYAIVKDMLFRGRINSPNTIDLLRSTTGSKIYKSDSLFKDLSSVDVSNGLVYTTNHFLIKDTSSWYKEIRVEAENSSERTSGNASLYTRNSYSKTYNVSNNSYVLVSSTSSSKAYVQFAIPRTLSAKYNIYAVFVPTCVVDTNDIRPFKATFRFIINSRIPGQAAIVQNIPAKITNPKSMTKLLVLPNYKFPYTDVDLYVNYESHVFLRITNEALESEKTKYNNTAMRVDCIILEPIAQ
jgi:hypothetical protein